MANFLVRTLTIMQIFIDVMVSLGYNPKELSKSLESKDGAFEITYNRNPLFEIVINRPDPLSKAVELKIENIGREDFDKIDLILNALESNFKNKLEFTFII